MVRPAMLAEGVGGKGRDSCFSGLSFGSAICPLPVIAHGVAALNRADDPAAIRAARPELRFETAET